MRELDRRVVPPAKAYLWRDWRDPARTEARIATAYDARAARHILDGIEHIDFTAGYEERQVMEIWARSLSSEAGPWRLPRLTRPANNAERIVKDGGRCLCRVKT
jgi:hypothetical protein